MLDFLHLPKPQNGYIDYFPGFSNTTGGSWEIWNKPRGISFIKIITIGGGGGGRSGWCADSTTRSGGGGGGSSGVTHVTIPAIFLPDRLYVSSGEGGDGGAATTTASSATAGSNGIGSYVSIAQSTAAIYVICYANGGGGAGAGSAGVGNAGTAGGVATIANALMAAQGNFTALAGQAGTAGNTTTGTAVTYPVTGLLLSGGACGGGGSISNGNQVNAPTQTVYNIFPTVPPGINGFNATSGSAGIEISQPLLSTGGSGGGTGSSTAANNGTGGRGGNGGFGSGGGGGGAGPTISGSGKGGDGGNGLVIISCW
jgi:hypothetical protein